MNEQNTLSYKHLVKYLNLSNKEAVQSFVGATDEIIKSDLISGVYEGGLKVWECSFDLVDYLN